LSEKLSGTFSLLGQDNRRAFPRRRAKGTALCHTSASVSLAGVPATILDISHGGIRLLVKQPFAAGDALKIELTPMFGHGTVTREAEVRWAQPIADGRTYLGCSWRHRLSFSELQKFF
jgi:hypothetical protein